jgi:hypothetical protein
VKSRLAPYRGPVARLKPARSQRAVIAAMQDREAVTTALESVLGAHPPERQRARLQEAARQVVQRLGDLTHASCSAVSRGPQASILVFGKPDGGVDGAD